LRKLIGSSETNAYTESIHDMPHYRTYYAHIHEPIFLGFSDLQVAPKQVWTWDSFQHKLEDDLTWRWRNVCTHTSLWANC